MTLVLLVVGPVVPFGLVLLAVWCGHHIPAPPPKLLRRKRPKTAWERRRDRWQAAAEAALIAVGYYSLESALVKFWRVNRQEWREWRAKRQAGL